MYTQTSRSNYDIMGLEGGINTMQSPSIREQLNIHTAAIAWKCKYKYNWTNWRLKFKWSCIWDILKAKPRPLILFTGKKKKGNKVNVCKSDFLK